MRISEDMIEKSLAGVLKQGGYRVVAEEIREGFEKPAVFIDCYPAEVIRLNADTEQVTDDIKIRYIPKTETVSHSSRVAQKLRELLMYKTLDVGDRRLTISSMEFEIEDCVVYAETELTYIQETPDEEYEKIETLKIGGDTYGTSVN